MPQNRIHDPPSITSRPQPAYTHSWQLHCVTLLQCKYVGLTIDNRLTFSRHIDLLVGKIAGKFKTFQGVRNSLDNRAQLM